MSAELCMPESLNDVHALLLAHRGELVAFVRRRAGHLVDPDDVVQRAAERALLRSEQLRDRASGRAWLFRIVRNVLADELRELGLPAPELAHDAVFDPPAERGETCRCALALARGLKPEYRTILERSVAEEEPIGALARELGITPNNAMVRLHRARRALKVLLAEHCGTTSSASCVDCGCEERGCCALA